MDNRIQEALKLLNIPFTDEQISTLKRYVAEINLFNPTYHLVGDTGKLLWTRHVFDSLVGYQTIKNLQEESGKEEFVVSDAGTGAGFPGIPLAIMMPSVKWVLIERMGRRVGFLKNALAVTGLSNRVVLIDKDLKEVKQNFDLMIMRAFRPLDVIAQDCFKLTNKVLAYKATEDYLEQELASLDKNLKVTIMEKEVPFLDRTRRLCLLERC